MQRLLGEDSDVKVNPTFGVSFGLPQGGGGGYPLNPFGSNPVVNPYGGSIGGPGGINLGLVSVNPLISVQVAKDEHGGKVIKPLVNLHVTPNPGLVHKVGSLIHGGAAHILHKPFLHKPFLHKPFYPPYLTHDHHHHHIHSGGPPPPPPPPFYHEKPHYYPHKPTFYPSKPAFYPYKPPYYPQRPDFGLYAPNHYGYRSSEDDVAYEGNRYSQPSGGYISDDEDDSGEYGHEEADYDDYYRSSKSNISSALPPTASSSNPDGGQASPKVNFPSDRRSFTTTPDRKKRQTAENEVVQPQEVSETH